MDRHVNNVRRMHMRTAYAFARRIPGLLVRIPVEGNWIARTMMHVGMYVRQAWACLHYTCVHMLNRTICRTCGKMHCRSWGSITYQNQLQHGNGPDTHNRSNLTSSTLDVHRIAPNSHSYNYIFKVLFKTPSGYLFSIGFGHISIFRWALAPIHILFRKNTNRIV